MTWKKTIAIGAVLLGVAGALGFYWCYDGRPRNLTLPGLVEIQEVRLSSKIGGRVLQVLVAEGDLVKPGQPLVVFDMPELRAQYEQVRARLQAAEADAEKTRNGPRSEEKDGARAAMQAAEARWQRLKAGAREEEIEQAKAEVESAEAELRWTETDLRRAAVLYPSKATPQSDYDAAVGVHGRILGRVNAARARLKLLKAGTRPEEIAEAEAELNRMRANYAMLETGSRSEDIAQAEARVAEFRARLQELEANLNEAVVKAAEPAVIEVLAVRPGDVVAPNQPVLRVLRAQDLWVKAYVPEVDLGRVRLHQEAEVTIDSYPGRRFSGTVVQVASASEFTPRNVQSVDERRHQVFAIKVRVADPEGIFKSGMAAEVVLPLHE